MFGGRPLELVEIMIFLFCVDTSASMNQRTTNGVRYIDAAKAGIEHFMLKRASDPSYATDRFFLVTFEEGLTAIKVRPVVILNH